MGKERIVLVYCKKCKKQQQRIVRGNEVIGKNKKCFYCGKNISLNKENIIKILM